MCYTCCAVHIPAPDVCTLEMASINNASVMYYGHGGHSLSHVPGGVWTSCIRTIRFSDDGRRLLVERIVTAVSGMVKLNIDTETVQLTVYEVPEMVSNDSC